MPTFDNPDLAKQFVRGFAHCTPTRKPENSLIACPECNGQMVYPEPGIIHLDPPRKRVRCTKCSYKTFEETDEPEQGVDIAQQIIDRQKARLSQKSDPSDERSSQQDLDNQCHSQEAQETKTDPTHTESETTCQ